MIPQDKIGKAYEYAYVIAFEDYLSTIKIKHSTIENSSLKIARDDFNFFSTDEQETLIISAKAGIEQVIKAEPIIIDSSYANEIFLELQPDNAGENGDVRDLLIKRADINWIIGVSIKHNHHAVKHSRLSNNIDFGLKWYGISVDTTYWVNVNPIFDLLATYKSKNLKWGEIPNKDTEIYIPILDAFKKELELAYSKDSKIVSKFVEYLIGKYDFYKAISNDIKFETDIIPFNLHGTLNKESQNIKTTLYISKLELPTEIIFIRFKPNSTSTLELFLNNGWQFSFRIHNASTYVETSLKFDIQIIGMPPVMTFTQKWNLKKV
jgi:hypothetical protein